MNRMHHSPEQLPLFDAAAPQPPLPTAPEVQELLPAEPLDDIDRLVNQGFTYGEARTMTSFALDSIKKHVPTAAPQPTRNPVGRRTQQPVDLRTLSPRARLLADSPPAHIRALMGRS